MSNRRRWIELGKDLLIVLLAISAVWLAVQSRLIARDSLAEELVQAGETAGQDRPDRTGLRPLRIVANRVGSSGDGRYASQYDQPATDALFEQTAGVLVEALSSMETPEPATRRQWQDALVLLPGVTFDFQGQVPLEVLTEGLTGQSSPVRADVRRLVVAVEEEDAVLYYADGGGLYYRCQVPAVNPVHVRTMLAGMTDNGPYYAAETDWQGAAAPESLFREENPPMPDYMVRNPAAGGQGDLEIIMEQLGISVSASRFYTSGDELVARTESDMLRLSGAGTLHYESDGGQGQRFRAQAARTSGVSWEAVKSCRTLAASVLDSRMGQGRLYLLSARAVGADLEVRFGYSLNGVPVSLGGRSAARFTVRNGMVMSFDLYLRSYELAGTAAQVLPPRQAEAAMPRLGAGDRELMLVYRDQGGELVQAGWAAEHQEQGA